ncbi:ABC transporter ATP-binding protein, partial [Arthrobacter deserti]|nr:ABC transporter ATP-binding protein [Arthrobacter deserti]
MSGRSQLAEEAREPAEDVPGEEYRPTEADGDMFGGTPAKKARPFWPSARRLFGLVGPGRAGIVAVLGMVGVAVVLNVVAPKVLGRAMDVIFAGVVGRGLPAGLTQEQVVAGLRAQGQHQFADMVSGMALVPGAGIDFLVLGRLIAVVLCLYLVASLFMWLQGWVLNRIVMRVVARL